MFARHQPPATRGWLRRLGKQCTCAGVGCDSAPFAGVRCRREAGRKSQRRGNYWMRAAYAGYLPLFVLTGRLVKRLEVLQRASWRHRNAALAANGSA